MGKDGQVSTGRFTDPAKADSDKGGKAAGEDDAPPFPGQDFVDPPMSVVGKKIVISVEPMPDDSEAPFALKPLFGEASDAGAGVLQDLPNQSAMNNAYGVASFGKLPAAKEKLVVDVKQLSALRGGYSYEGWVVIDDAPVSTGRFNIVGEQTEYSFPIPAAQAEKAAAFVLSIEPPVSEDDPAPADTKVLGGAFDNGKGLASGW